MKPNAINLKYAVRLGWSKEPRAAALVAAFLALLCATPFEHSGNAIADQAVGCVSPEYLPNPMCAAMTGTNKCIKMQISPAPQVCGTNSIYFVCFTYTVDVGTMATYTKTYTDPSECGCGSSGWTPTGNHVVWDIVQAYNNDTSCH